MKNELQAPLDSGGFPHLVRERLNRLFEEAVKCPVVIVCAGAGFGKTRAVADFLSQQNHHVVWEQLSERDNVGMRSWENVSNSFAQMNKQLGEDFREFGFPDTEEKIKQFYRQYERSMLNQQQYIIVIDDFHFIKDQAVLDVVEHSLYYMPSNRNTMIIISREPPHLNLAGMRVRGLVAQINEADLSFTESELVEYLSQQGLSVEPETVREIFQDTKGWAFAVNFIVQSLKKSLNYCYSGFIRNDMKKNFFQLMETEVFNMASERLQHFLACLSLVSHLSSELVSLLAGEDKSLLAELERLSSFVRFDNYLNAYLIHHLFLDFLYTKQEILTEEEKLRTYQIAADWCRRNDFKIDALSYYEKIGDYGSIVSIFYDIPLQVPQSIALFAEQIFNRAPPDAYTRVKAFAGMHVRVVMRLGKWDEVLKLLEYYEANLLRLHEDDKFRCFTLSGLYYAWGSLRQMMSTIDDCYDFDVCYAKMSECLTKTPAQPNKLSSYSIGPWFSLVGSARGGAPQEYIEALVRSEERMSRSYNGCMAGVGDLAYGELKYYQGKVRAAESFIIKGLARARECGQFELVHRALFYMIKIAVSQGDFAKAEQALMETEALLNETDFITRFFAYDITLGAYYNFVLQPDKVPGWMRGKFSHYSHPKFYENSENQIKLYYCYITENYASLLTYMEEQKRRESILYGRVELQAMEACVLFKTKNNADAFAALREAYETALPNSLLMPFIWLGDDMRNLAFAALYEKDFAIPKPWLETIIRKSTSYAEYHKKFISDYKKAKGLDEETVLTSSESEVLRAMHNGISRSEIATNLNLPISTVKVIINSIYEKLDARNVADVKRIVAERKLI